MPLFQSLMFGPAFAYGPLEANMANRREFMVYAGSALGFAIWRPSSIWRLVAPTAAAQTAGPAEFRDLYVRSIGFQDILTAAQWKAGQPVTLSKTIEPGSHGHQVIIAATELAQLSSGQDVSFQSQRAQGHQHNVTIRLRDVVPGGDVIRNTPEPLKPPDQAGPPATQTPTTPSTVTTDGTFAAILGEGSEPYLYVEALQPIRGESLYYCLGDEHSCSRMDWVEMRSEPLIAGRQIYRSKYNLKLAANDVIHISALDNAGQRRELHARITPLGNGLFLRPSGER